MSEYNEFLLLSLIAIKYNIANMLILSVQLIYDYLVNN